MNDEWLHSGMLSLQMYVDAGLVKANVSGYNLAPSGMAVAEFKELAIKEDRQFMITETTVDEDGVEHGEVRRFQKSDGRLPLSPVDTDVRWRTSHRGKPSGMHCQENVIVDLGGFILSRGVTHASESEPEAVPALIEGLPLQPVPLAADTGYNVGQLRQSLEERNIDAYIPVHHIQEMNTVSRGGFVYHVDHLVCPKGKILRRGSFHSRDGAYQYVAHQKDCQACPVEDSCLPPGQKRRYIGLAMFHSVCLRTRERNQTAACQREWFRRRTIGEGTFACLDRLGWEKSRLRGLWKADCVGYMAALAHNVLKMAPWLGRGVKPPGPVVPAKAIAADGEYGACDAMTLHAATKWHFLLISRWVFDLGPALR